MEKPYDMVVVGAGWFGLAAARTYIELHPDENITLLESSGSCGGTWASHRLYPGLKSNNMVGTYEYPDFPMKEEVYGVKPGSHIPGPILHRYLTDYAKTFNVFPRVQFHTKVDSIQPSSNGGWQINTINSEEARGIVETKKLILATGLTSQPNLPKYKGSETFKHPHFHAKDFCKEAESLKGVRNAVVVGGAKSAFDVAYALVDSGAQVDLVVRPNGNGPVWIAPPYVTPFKKWLEKLLHMRCLTWFSPCPWGGEDGYSGMRRFLHNTAVGRWIVDRFWDVLSADVISANGYDKHEEVKKLKPWNSAFWVGSGLSIHNYSTNLFDMVKDGRIRVHIADIDYLETDTVHLSTGEVLAADALICSTGWKKEPALKFTNFGEAGIGLAHSQEEKAKLNKEADEKVLQMFPRLRDQPDLRFTPKDKDPYRLYRFIIPPTMMEKRNFAFAGMVSTVSTAICATVQALWISAYLDGDLDRVAKTDAEVTDEVMLHTQWGKWRYPCGYGANLPDFVFDALPYADLLLNDLGVKNHRKSGGLAEIFSPYGPEDFVGLNEEWKSAHRKLKENGQ